VLLESVFALGVIALVLPLFQAARRLIGCMIAQQRAYIADNVATALWLRVRGLAAIPLVDSAILHVCYDLRSARP